LLADCEFDKAYRERDPASAKYFKKDIYSNRFLFLLENSRVIVPHKTIMPHFKGRRRRTIDDITNQTNHVIEMTTDDDERVEIIIII
jgi:hypothetical protein